MADYFEQIFYDEYRRTHAEKGDNELRAIVLTNAKKTLALPTNPTAQMLAEAKKWQVESKVCNEILEERKEKKAATAAALSTWKEKAEEKAKSLILNLPTAVSFEGQLIAAILEEEKLTADELAGWCDELAVLDQSELERMLEALVAEQILKEKDGRYECINICTPTLYPDNPVNWGVARAKSAAAGRNSAPGRLAERTELILMVLLVEDGPLSKEDIHKKFRHFTSLVKDGTCLESDLEMDEYELSEVLDFLCGNQVLDRLYMAGEWMYYFKQLGKVVRQNKDIDEMMRAIRAAKEGTTLTGVEESNLGYMEEILRVLAESGEEMAITDIMAASPILGGLSAQRVSALTRRLKDENYVTRIETNRKAYFVLGNKE